MVELYQHVLVPTEKIKAIQVEAPKRVCTPHTVFAIPNYQTTNNTSPTETDNTCNNFTCIAPEQIPDGYNFHLH